MCFAALWVSPSLVVAHWCARGLTRASPLARMIANPITVIVIILVLVHIILWIYAALATAL